MTAQAFGPQFGRFEPDHAYMDRPAAFGVVLRDDLIACVEIARDGAIWLDLPGGALDPGEDEAQALVREFIEETGLSLEPNSRFAQARQCLIKEGGQRANNLCGFWTARVVSEDPASKIEADHTLVWKSPMQAVKGLRHDAHAWAVAAWLRARA